MKRSRLNRGSKSGNKKVRLATERETVDMIANEAKKHGIPEHKTHHWWNRLSDWERVHWRSVVASAPVFLGAYVAPHIAEIEGTLSAVPGGVIGATAIGATIGVPVAFMWKESLDERTANKRKT